MTKFYMLYAEGQQTPAKKHATVEEAEAEAKRLLISQPRLTKIYILESHSVAERETPPVAIFRIR